MTLLIVMFKTLHIHMRQLCYCQADDDDLDTLAYLENETSYRHGKGQKTKSVLQTVVVSIVHPCECLCA